MAILHVRTCIHVHVVGYLVLALFVILFTKGRHHVGRMGGGVSQALSRHIYMYMYMYTCTIYVYTCSIVVNTCVRVLQDLCV